MSKSAVAYHIICSWFGIKTINRTLCAANIDRWDWINVLNLFTELNEAENKTWNENIEKKKYSKIVLFDGCDCVMKLLKDEKTEVENTFFEFCCHFHFMPKYVTLYIAFQCFNLFRTRFTLYWMSLDFSFFSSCCPR